MNDDVSHLQKAILARASNINTVLLAAFGILILAALVKLAGKDEIDVKGVKINIRYLQLIMVLMTTAHFYTAFSFDQMVSEVARGGDTDKAKNLFIELRDNGPLFFQGLISRIKYVQFPSGPVFIMDNSDPTTWLAYGSALASFIVMVRWTEATPLKKLASIIGSGLLVVSNWLIGGTWAVHASCLSEINACKIIPGFAL